MKAGVFFNNFSIIFVYNNTFFSATNKASRAHKTKVMNGLFTKTSFTGKQKGYPLFSFQNQLYLMKLVDIMKKNLDRPVRNMAKTAKNEKVNKGRSATWWSNFANFNGSKFVFHKAL